MVPPDQAVVSAWVALLTPVSVAVLTVVQLLASIRSKKRGEEAKAAVQEVKITLAETGAQTNKKLDAIHTLVNSEYGIALRAGATALEKIAAMTKTADDIESAKVARQMADDHDRKQRDLDLENAAKST